VNKAAAFLFGGGWWTVWYLALWSATLPALVLLGWYLRSPASAGQHPGAASTAQALGMVSFALIVPVSVILWTLGRASAGPTKYALGAVALVALWFVSQMLIYYCWYYIDMPKLPREERAPRILGMAATALALHLFNLYAAWRFRRR
jgi:phosphoglycerol transferase MdoB-like AlkP superfamily enzyme